MKKSILMQYVISYATIMAILFVGFAVYTNRSYASAIRKNTIEANINKLSTIRYQHEEMLLTLSSIGNQIALSPYIWPFRLLDDPMRAYHLKLQLTPYAVTNDFIDGLYLIFHEDDYLYSSATSVGLDMFINKLMLYEDTSPAQLRAYLRQKGRGLIFLPAQNVKSILIDGSSRVVSVLVPISSGERLTYGNLLCQIKESTYHRFFADEIYEPRNTYILQGDQVLAALRGMDIPDAALKEALNGQGDSTDFTVDGREYLLVAQQNQLFSMSYATLIPMESIHASITKEQIAFGLFLLALSVPCALLTVYFSRRHTRPIKALRNLANPDATAQDDFAVIHTGIEALNLRNRDLNTRLEQTLPARKANFVKDFVKGRFSNREAVLDAAAKVDMQVDKPCYLIALVGAPSLELDKPEPRMNAMLARLGSEVGGWGIELVAMEQHLLALFADSGEALYDWVSNVHRMEQYAGITISLSNVHMQIEEAGSAYLEATTAYDNRFVMGGARILRFSDIGAAAMDIVPFTRSYLDGFRKALRSRDAKALGEKIDELFRYLGNTELSLFAFRMIYHNVIAAMLNERMDGPHSGRSMDAIQYYDVFTLSGCQSISDLDDILRKLCNDILLQNAPDEEAAPTIVSEIAAYMQAHYTDPMLSMSAIADHYGISAARLSLDFKEQKGVTPSDYLLLLRMEKAKELLAKTENSVKDIGSALGYYDASGFIRRFKHYMAMTPVQYRQSLKDKQTK